MIIFMRNIDVARLLDRTANILAIRGENRYRVRAYRRAARTVSAESRDIEILYRENKLQAIDGVGGGIAASIKEIMGTGKLGLLERLEKGGLPDISGRSVPLAAALSLASELLPQLSRLAGIVRVDLGGDARRKTETVDRLVVVVEAAEMEQARQSLKQTRTIKRQRWEGHECQAVHSYGLPLALYLVEPADFGFIQWVVTGHSTHIQQVAERLKAITGEDVLGQDTEEGGRPSEEKDIYARAQLPFIAPELREGRGEVEAAALGNLPKLVAIKDYRGDLHVHTDWSDGAADLEQMVVAAVERGYEYVTITDHSHSLKIARGLSPERLLLQREAIIVLNKKYPQLTILWGIEADILADGSLDAPDELLSQLDVVIASVHSRFGQEGSKITERICRALQNPYVDLLAHPTGRLLGKREAYGVDMEAVIRQARATGTALEINASPDRLDINDRLARTAGEAGVFMAVNTDAHSQLDLDNVGLGLAMARRGWLAPANILNTFTVERLLAFLGQNKQDRLRR